MTKSNLYTAVNEVMKAVEYVQKTRASQGTAISGDSLIAALRPEIVKNGLVILPVKVKKARQGNYQTAGKEYQGKVTPGRLMNREIATMVYKVIHAPSGEFDFLQVQMEAADVADKASHKLATFAYTYILRQLFMIEGGDDESKSAAEKTTATKQKTTKPKVSPPRETTGSTKNVYGPWNATTVNNVMDKTPARDLEEALRWLKPLEDLDERPNTKQVRDIARDYQGFMDASDTHPQAIKKALVIHNKKVAEKAKGK